MGASARLVFVVGVYAPSAKLDEKVQVGTKTITVKQCAAHGPLRTPFCAACGSPAQTVQQEVPVHATRAQIAEKAAEAHVPCSRFGEPSAVHQVWQEADAYVVGVELPTVTADAYGYAKMGVTTAGALQEAAEKAKAIVVACGLDPTAIKLHAIASLSY